MNVLIGFLVYCIIIGIVSYWARNFLIRRLEIEEKKNGGDMNV